MSSSFDKLFNPFTHIKNTFKKVKEGDIKGLILDPGGAFEADKPEKVEDTTLSDAELGSLAQQEAARRAKMRKETTRTVLTSPLGASGATTQTKKLGG